MTGRRHQRISFPLQVPPVPLDVLHHCVLPRQLVVVGKVVDDLEVVHPITCHSFKKSVQGKCSPTFLGYTDGLNVE